MGLDHNGVKLLLSSQRHGVCFTKVATIGRQAIQVSFNALKAILNSYSIHKTDYDVNKLLKDNDGFADSLLKMLGANEICSIDASPYEGASIIHNMNYPIGNDLKEAFSVVIDSGTLEHIFDFPRAIKNCMEMVRISGHFICITPTNNFMGHGFYQFSPELFYGIFTKENGFNLEKMIVFENTINSKWYEVISPEICRSRVGLNTFRQVYLFILAKKLASPELTSMMPNQIDYLALWNTYKGLYESSGRQTSKSSIQKSIDTMTLLANKLVIFRLLRKIYYIIFRFKKPFFKRIVW